MRRLGALMGSQKDASDVSDKAAIHPMEKLDDEATGRGFKATY